MKNLLFILVVALLCFSNIDAQHDGLTDNEIDKLLSLDITEESQTIYNNNEYNVSNLVVDDIRIGVSGGYINSSINGTDAESFNCGSGFMVGGIILLPLTSDVAVQAEVQYAQMGSGYSEDDYGDSGTSSTRGNVGISGDYKLNYLLVPASLRYNIISGLGIEAGPQFGFLLSAKDEYTFNGVSEEMDVKDQTKGFDFGVNVGASYIFDLGLFVRARYYIGLTELNDLEFPGNESWKNSAFSASVGYFFN